MYNEADKCKKHILRRERDLGEKGDHGYKKDRNSLKKDETGPKSTKFKFRKENSKKCIRKI